jgi:hypothetical protein
MMEPFYLAHQAKSSARPDLTGRPGLVISPALRGQFEPVGLQATLNNLLKGRGVRNPALAIGSPGFLFGECQEPAAAAG